MVFLCSLGVSVLCLSASWLFWALFFGLLFFGAENSESCLNQFSGKRDVRGGSIRNPFRGFKLQTRSAKVPSLNIKTMIHFGFLIFVFCLWIKVELILVLVNRKPLKLKHNKAFKRDSCRVAFLVCGWFWWWKWYAETWFMRHSPLNAALYAIWRKPKNSGQKFQFSALGSGFEALKYSSSKPSFLQLFARFGLPFIGGFLLGCWFFRVSPRCVFRWDLALWICLSKRWFACWEGAFSGVVSSRGFSG